MTAGAPAGATADPRRSLLLGYYRAALAAVDGRRRLRAALAADRDPRPAHVLAVGKAAAAMALGARDALGASLERALVIAPADADWRELARDGRIECRAGGHPLPDESSLAAGAAACAFADATPPGSRVLLLASGGASALCESLAPGTTLAAFRARCAAALADGSDIAALNAVRRRHSLVKAGQLVARFRGSAVRGFMLSDVPGDDPEVFVSGLLAAPGCEIHRVGNLDDAIEAVMRAARAHGLAAMKRTARLAGDAAEAARRLCHEHAVCGADLLVAGGETVVRLPPRPGRGGRCQHLALAAAQCIAGHADLVVLAAGTDGRDGASEDAGAIVDGETIVRIADGGLDASRCLATAASGDALEASGDLVHTGATGTNVGDLVLVLRRPPDTGAAG